MPCQPLLLRENAGKCQLTVPTPGLSLDTTVCSEDTHQTFHPGMAWPRNLGWQGTISSSRLADDETLRQMGWMKVGDSFQFVRKLESVAWTGSFSRVNQFWSLA